MIDYFRKFSGMFWNFAILSKKFWSYIGLHQKIFNKNTMIAGGYGTHEIQHPRQKNDFNALIVYVRTLFYKMEIQTRH